MRTHSTPQQGWEMGCASLRFQPIGHVQTAAESVRSRHGRQRAQGVSPPSPSTHKPCFPVLLPSPEPLQPPTWQQQRSAAAGRCSWPLPAGDMVACGSSSGSGSR